jgi:dTMP kinase
VAASSSHSDCNLFRPPFIAFEGVEGCGKSTQIELLSQSLTEMNRDFIVTREPGGTTLGDGLRELLLSPASTGIDGMTELFILEASRRTHMQTVIRPALEKGTVVICDRYADSSVAYQGGGRDLGVELVTEMNLRATDGLMPDVTILLDLDPAIGLSRVGKRDRPEDRMEQEALDFHQRVRATYLEIAESRGDAYRVCDGSGEPEKIAAEIINYLRPYLAAGG